MKFAPNARHDRGWLPLYHDEHLTVWSSRLFGHTTLRFQQGLNSLCISIPQETAYAFACVIEEDRDQLIFNDGYEEEFPE
jgi:hypothetical protein